MVLTKFMKAVVIRSLASSACVSVSSEFDCRLCEIFFSSVIEFMSSAIIVAFSFLERDLLMPFAASKTVNS